MFSQHLGRALRALAFILAAAVATTGFALAQATSYLSGVVTANGQAVAGAGVQINGPTLHREAVTDARGTFAFSAVPLGRYSVSGINGPLSAVVDVDVTSSGASVNLVLKATKTIGRTTATVTSRAVVAQRAGTDVTLSTATLARSPAAGSTSGMLLQVPGAARGANGAVHVNGDHGDINYVIDGVALPQALNRVIGNEVDASNVGSAEVLEGAYPAQYGERFGAVLNLASRAGTPGPAGVTFDAAGGAFARYEATLGYHAPVGRGGSLLVAARTGRDGRALDPPSPDAPHDAGSSANQFVRVTLPYGKSSFANFTLSHSLQTYQIPADVAAGAPAAQDDVERQDDVFASLQFRRAIGDRGTFSFGPSVKRSRIQDLPDRANDFAAGLAAGAPANCSADVTTCALSLFSDRTSVDYRINADYDVRSAAHEVRAGIVYDVTTVAKRYAIALQPFNPFALAPFTVVDAAPNTGHLAEGYLQDSWRMGARWRLDYGVRADVFAIASPEFASGFAQLSPRVKLTRTLGDAASVYVYYGRFFTPFSLENVSPSVARIIQPSSGNFDLRPQRDSDYEIGGHVALGRGDLGVRVAQKNATDVIDDTQVGTTNLHQDINFAQGRIATQSLAYQRPLARGGRVYGSLAHTHAVVKDCETALLAPCSGGGSRDWLPADHEELWDANAGLLINDRHNGWLSASVEYGSGLTTAPSDPSTGFVNRFCPPDPRTGVGSSTCKVPPHLTLDVEKGIAVGRGALALRVRNLFDDRYFITFANAQGNHVARPRAIELNYRLER
ncbi:MAG TPA: TonB-dependent receptor [Dongiaceae bacterium]|nr:TonB-dependent receptor [Dongiaceae bacterium]